MSLQERLQQVKLSTNEQVILDFIEAKQFAIAPMSTREIARATYTSASSVVRLCQKLGYRGFEDFKNDYLSECHYYAEHFQRLDANIPFTRDHTPMQIVGIMADLMEESAQDTRSLVDHDRLLEALGLLHEAGTIYVYATENHLFLAELLKYKLVRIGYHVILEHQFGNQVYSAYLAMPKDVALVISYSGESPNLIPTIDTLNKRKIPIIAITGKGQSHLQKASRVVLEMTTREKLHSKIGNFTTEYAILLWLNILYAGLYARDYDQASKKRIERTRKLETRRHAVSPIIAEKEEKS